MYTLGAVQQGRNEVVVDRKEERSVTKQIERERLCKRGWRKLHDKENDVHDFYLGAPYCRAATMYEV